MQFTKATKAKAKLRLALVGPSGSGKTYTALAIATNLGARVAVIDTERGSASKYAGEFAFDTLELDSFEPGMYVQAIDAAARAGYDVVIIDSWSHAWIGKGGALEQVDNIAKRSQSRNSFAAWRDVTPQHNAMVDAIVRAPIHVIATMRAKTEYVLEKDDRGKTAPRKVGIQPVQRDGVEYEFDVVCDLDEENNLIVGKTRCSALQRRMFTRAGKDVADVLRAWLTDGAEPKAPDPCLDPQVAALAASIDWGKWEGEQTLKLAEAETMGELGEAWLSINEEIKRLCGTVPKTHVAGLKKAKDARKVAMSSGSPTGEVNPRTGDNPAYGNGAA